MREEGIARGLAAVLTMLALIFAPVYLMFGLAPARLALFFGLGAAAIGIAVGWLLGRRNPALQILAAAAPAAALAWLLSPAMPGGAVALYVMLGLGVLLAVWAERLFVTAQAHALRPIVVLAPLAAWLVVGCVLFLSARGRADAPGMWPLIIVPAAIWFSAAMLMLNRMGLRQAARAAAGSGVPAGVRRGGTVGAIVLVAATLVLASFGSIVGFLADAIRTLVYWVLVALSFLGSLFATKGSGEGGLPQGNQLPQVPEGTASPLMQLLSDIAVILTVALGVALILYGIYKIFPKLWRKLMERLGALFGSWREEEDFRDRSESLLSLRQAMRNTGAQIARFARRFRRRARFGDFHTNADRARFLFREYVHGLISAGHEPHPSATANEIAKPAPALARAYNLARYGEEEPTDEQIGKARNETGI